MGAAKVERFAERGGGGCQLRGRDHVGRSCEVAHAFDLGDPLRGLHVALVGRYARRAQDLEGQVSGPERFPAAKVSDRMAQATFCPTPPGRSARLAGGSGWGYLLTAQYNRLRSLLLSGVSVG